MRNRARPEGSIAEGYTVEEAITFSSQYLRGVHSKFSGRLRNDNDSKAANRVYSIDVFRPVGKGIGKKTVYHLDCRLLDMATWFVLNNYPAVQPYLE